jgi:probable rRNA maturation factor
MTSRSNALIHFYFDKTTFSLRNRNKLKHFILQMFKANEKKLASLSFVFSTDREVLKINRQYLNHDFYTDVIAFDLSETGLVVQGEIYISVDRVLHNAKAFHVPFHEELHRVIFHGVLHLCGYEDKSLPGMEEMRKKEEFYLAKYRMQ